MRTIFFGLTLVLLVSCQQDYLQIVDTKSTNAKLDENNNYIYETPALKITYKFWHDQGLMSFTIHNKQNTPLYVDWSRSSLIYNGTKINYWISENDKESSNYFGKYIYSGPIEAPGYGVSEEIGVSNSSRFNSIEQVTFIPPNSSYHRSQFRLMPEAFVPLDESKFEMVTNRENEKKQTKVFMASYDEKNTPLSLRNFLAISKTGKFDDELFIDNGFYVSGVKAMYIGHALGKYTEKVNKKGEKIFELPDKKNSSFYILHYDVNKVEGLKNDKYSTKRF